VADLNRTQKKTKKKRHQASASINLGGGVIPGRQPHFKCTIACVGGLAIASVVHAHQNPNSV
jgi:hypothetical protein